MYLDNDFPPITGENLPKSPRDLGISRADLWAFSGLVALDRVQTTSRDLCANYLHNLTCGDWTTSCWAPFPRGWTKKLFKTGRTDCEAHPSASQFQGYLASKKEAMPNANGNGVETAQYFKDKFNLDAREALALMGAHTIGQYSTFQTHLDYAWVREKDSQRNQVKFIRYRYKVLTITFL